MIHRLRHAGIPLSDRRAVKLQRLMAASALLCGRLEVNAADLWVLRYIWDAEDQQEVLGSIVQDAIDKSDASRTAGVHPRLRGGDAPDAESLAGDLRRIAERLAKGPIPTTERSYLKDRLGLLAARCPWVQDPQQRASLEQQLSALMAAVGGRGMKERSSTVASPPALPAALGDLPRQGRSICRRAFAAGGRHRGLRGTGSGLAPRPGVDEKLHRRLAAIPGGQRFYVLSDGQLQPVASRLPKGRLPGGPWTPLPKWLALGLPPATLAGRSNGRCADGPGAIRARRDGIRAADDHRPLGGIRDRCA